MSQKTSQIIVTPFAKTTQATDLQTAINAELAANPGFEFVGIFPSNDVDFELVILQG